MILAFNTSTQQSSIAVLRGDGAVAAEQIMCGGKGHFGDLMPALHMLLHTCRLTPKDIKCLAVAIGPGSFTGLRVGLSLAKGFCHALHVPIIGISSLKAMAFQMPFTHDPIAPILTSRKGEVFTALFLWDQGNQLRRKKKDNCFKLNDFPSLFSKPTVFVGNDYGSQVETLKDLLGVRARIAPPHCWHLKASSVGALALYRFNAGDLDDPGTLTPVYFRPPDIRPSPLLPLDQ